MIYTILKNDGTYYFHFRHLILVYLTTSLIIVQSFRIINFSMFLIVRINLFQIILLKMVKLFKISFLIARVYCWFKIGHRSYLLLNYLLLEFYHLKFLLKGCWIIQNLLSDVRPYLLINLLSLQDFLILIRFHHVLYYSRVIWILVWIYKPTRRYSKYSGGHVNGFQMDWYFEMYLGCVFIVFLLFDCFVDFCFLDLIMLWICRIVLSLLGLVFHLLFGRLGFLFSLFVDEPGFGSESVFGRIEIVVRNLGYVLRVGGEGYFWRCCLVDMMTFFNMVVFNLVFLIQL